MTTKPRGFAIAIGPRWRTPCLQDVRVYHGADICGDHHLAIAKFKVKLKRKKKKDSKPQQFDINKLNDAVIGAQFLLFLSNRFSALADLVPGSLDWWDQLKDAMSAAGEEILGHKKSLKEPWISDRTWELIAERKALHQRRFTPSDGEDAYQEYIKKDKAVKSSAQRDKWEWLDRQAEEAQEAASHSDMCMDKKICGAVKTGSGSVKAKDGTLLSRGEDKMVRWAEHFKEVLNRLEPACPATVEDPPQVLPIDTSDFSEDEICKAISSLKNNKSPGNDGITA